MKLILSACVLLAGSSLASAALTPEETQQLAEAKAAVLKTTEMRAATAKFDAARKAYQLDRAKFPSERDKKVAAEYRKAQKEYEEALNRAILAQNPALAPLLAKADAPKRKRNEGETVADSDLLKNPAIRPIKDELSCRFWTCVPPRK